MKFIKHFSIKRLLAMVTKEFVQMRRDRMTFAMMLGIPLIQLILFGYAINTNPRHLPTAVVAADYSNFTRTYIEGLKNSDYFEITRFVSSEKEAQKLLKRGDVTFVLNFPQNFTRKLVRGERPQILLEIDGTDPAASSNAASAINTLTQNVFNRDLNGPLTSLQYAPPPATLNIHALYNPGQITQYNIVPGLLGVVLTMTMVIITSLAVTRERERGTMESLLATPIQPIEVVLGKLIPFILVGYVQVTIILLAAHGLFQVPIEGSVLTLLTATLPFIAANLAVGLTFSTLASNQLQAMQSAIFFFLPSLLLSGFMFPFRGMPMWAQYLGNVFPLTHFLVIVRGIMLKGNGWVEIWPAMWPILAFMLVVLLIAIRRYKQTLD
ncbi:MAG: ABC transporter permease [Gammaproteobacteria bacterium]